MPTKERYQTRLAPDTGEAVEEYAEDHDVTTSEAVRRLIRAGLDAERDDRLDPDEIREDLQEIRGAVEDDQDDTKTATYYQRGTTTDRVGGGVLTVAIISAAAYYLISPLAGRLTAVLLLAVATYYATTHAIRAARIRL